MEFVIIVAIVGVVAWLYHWQKEVKRAMFLQQLDLLKKDAERLKWDAIKNAEEMEQLEKDKPRAIIHLKQNKKP